MEYKLVVIGSGGVGKSALTIQYIQETFVDTVYPTIEDSYRKQVDVDGQAFMLDILDTAGQDEFSGMRSEYMSKGDGFLLVFSITDPQSFEDCNKLYEELLKSKDATADSKIPIILVGNKCDCEDQRGVTKEEAEELSKKYGSLCKYYETSAKERINVDEIFEEVVRLIYRVENNEPISNPAVQENVSTVIADGEAPQPTNQTTPTTPVQKKKKKKGCMLL